MMKDKIRHAGVVESVEAGCVRVRIVQSSACSSCKVSAHCHASESKEKLVDVRDVDGSAYRVGEHVVVCAQKSVGYLASLYGYIIPLLLMMMMLVVVVLTTHSEGAAALSAIGVLIPYYIVLYLLRSKLNGRLTFHLEK